MIRLDEVRRMKADHTFLTHCDYCKRKMAVTVESLRSQLFSNRLSVITIRCTDCNINPYLTNIIADLEDQ